MPTSSCSRQVWLSPSLHNLLMTRIGRIKALFTVLFVIALVAAGGQIYGQHLAYHDMLDRDQAVRQLEIQSQALDREKISQSAEVTSLQAQLADAKQKLNTVLPAKDTYTINPNQALVVAGGRLTLGLVGMPTSDGVTINVNGKQFPATAGDVIRVAENASSPCTVVVDSFDMFSAVLTASCTEARIPQRPK
jgi:hypothetical protein